MELESQQQQDQEPKDEEEVLNTSRLGPPRKTIEVEVDIHSNNHDNNFLTKVDAALAAAMDETTQPPKDKIVVLNPNVKTTTNEIGHQQQQQPERDNPRQPRSILNVSADEALSLANTNAYTDTNVLNPNVKTTTNETVHQQQTERDNPRQPRSILNGKRERLYKVLVVGELGTGKTSIIKRYVHQFFSQHYRATIGVDFALKVLRWDPETVVRLQLWDIAGQERFGSMTRVYYKEAVGAFVVFDVTRSATLDAVPKWKADLDAKVVLPDGRSIPAVLLANKSDQPKEGIAANREKMNEFSKQHGFAAWFETSAKENIHIDESASFLVSKILEMDRWSQEPMARDPEKLELGMNGKHKAGGASSNNCPC